jgi:uncharacterized protein (DUF1778 family)
MKITKKKDSRIEIRIAEKDHLLLRVQAEKCNKTVSSYLSMLIDTAIRPLKDKLIHGELSYEDLETFLNDKLQFRKLFKK